MNLRANIHYTRDNIYTLSSLPSITFPAISLTQRICWLLKVITRTGPCSIILPIARSRLSISSTWTQYRRVYLVINIKYLNTILGDILGYQYQVPGHNTGGYTWLSMSSTWTQYRGIYLVINIKYLNTILGDILGYQYQVPTIQGNILGCQYQVPTIQVDTLGYQYQVSRGIYLVTLDEIMYPICLACRIGVARILKGAS